uniref:Uncharacterized protein n=1 Tax=viral metagenome TaxID=1070528 RepID=A0A6M3JIN4_9ZZZZ
MATKYSAEDKYINCTTTAMPCKYRKKMPWKKTTYICTFVPKNRRDVLPCLDRFINPERYKDDPIS